MDANLAAELQRAGYESIETHISRVFLRDADVFKLKRAVSLGFLDYSTLEKRKEACEAEVILNRRLAHDVYLGVVALVRDERGALCFEPADQVSSKVLDWAVHMRRLLERERADVLLSRGRLHAFDVEQLAIRIAEFHRGARSDEETARLGGYDALTQNVRENFAQLASLEPHLERHEAAQLQDYQLSFVERERAMLERRARAGFVRDGHGDLRLEHCYLVEGARFEIIDCIEFNQRFRFADVCADLAFLTMDLRHQEQPVMADLLLAAYARESRDYGLYGLLDFYESYRATVRGKVTAMLAQDGELPEPTKERARAEARRYLVQALTSAGRPLHTATAVVTFGLIASGKSTVARALFLRYGLAVLCADEIRKQLLGLAPTAERKEQPFVGVYGEQMTDRVYEEMFARAAQVLASGRGVVFDASFRAKVHRERVRQLAAQYGVEVLFVECEVDRETALARLAERAQQPHISDGRAEIYDAFAENFEPTHDLPVDRHVRCSTKGPVNAALERWIAPRLA
ncbi:MAG TPA: AAA family ATPase [Polyangiales bacterium]